MKRRVALMVLVSLVVASCGGESEESRNAALPPRPVVSQLGVREQGACLLTSAPAMWCWGTGASYGNGDGTLLAAPVPNPIVIGNNLVPRSVSSGRGSHACAVVDKGDVYCWGLNNFRQITLEPTNVIREPTKVPNLGGLARQVVTGLQSTCALMADATVKCWGSYAGFIGSPTVNNAQYAGPTTVPGLANVTKLSASSSHVCALQANGAAYCWGNNDMGQLGTGGPNFGHQPAAVRNLDSVIDISAGNRTTCAVLSNGQVKCWGSNQMFGSGYSFNQGMINMFPADPVLLDRPAVAVSVGTWTHCALLDDATVKCWGQYPATNNIWYIPTVAAGMTNLATIATGSDNELCGITYAGGVLCIGTNRYYIPGSGIEQAAVQSVPAFVSGFADPVVVAPTTTVAVTTTLPAVTTTAPRATTTLPATTVPSATTVPPVTTVPSATTVAPATASTGPDAVVRDESLVAGPLPATPETPPTSAAPPAEPAVSPAATRTVLTLKVKKTLSAATLARNGRLSVPRGGKVSITVPTTKKVCSVSKTTLKGVKAGACRVRVTVKPVTGRSRSAVVTVTVVP
jgi:alpha-tubulin suppressor-like RCC1 family protein